MCLLATRVDAASVTLAWDPNSEADLARYYVGYRTSPAGTETLVNVGLVTTWTLTTAVEGSTYYFRVYAENQAGLRSAPSNEVSTTIPTTTPPPTGGGLALERGQLSFGVVKSGSTVTQSTPGQKLMVTQTASTPTAWTATSSNSRLRVTPASGTGTTPLTVSVQTGSSGVGTYNDTLTIRPTGSTATLTVAVRTRIYSAGTTTGPTGFFDTPADGVVNVAGSLPVTGWAVDDVNVARVDIYRDSVGSEPPNALILLGTGSLIAGSRPDVESLYPNHPLNYRGGWGFMVLSNMLPDRVNGRGTGGNGAFRLHAYAVDAEGKSTYLGAKNFSANNAASVKPFGTIDTPTQGGTASGGAYMVWGWALSPRGTIPSNGSTITVFVDGSAVGHPVYNNNRADIAGLFPGYANSNGAIGYLPLNTTTLSNGNHTISWTVTDNLGNTEGIGSRFFTVQNGTSAVTSAAVEGSTLALGSHGAALGQSVEAVSEAPPEYSLVEVKKVASDDPAPQLVVPESTGEVLVQTRETEHVEVRLAGQFGDDAGGTYEGYLVVGGRLRALPVGSSLDARAGIFRWQPGPGFLGNYEFVFLRNLPGGWKTRIPVNLRIAPKFDRGDGSRDDRK